MSTVNQNDENRGEEIRQALAQMVCYDSVEPSKCCNESQGFKAFMASLNPTAVPYLDLASLKQNCLKLHEKERTQVRDVFSNLKGQISLSMDLLMCEKPVGSFHEHLCLSAHFIDNNWNLRKWVIHYCDVYGSDMLHPTVATSDSIKEWNIEDKVFSLSIGGEIDTSMVKEQVEGRKALLLDGRLFHIQCCGDMISQMVQKGFGLIDETIDKVQSLQWSKSLPLWYLTSTKLSNALECKESGGFSRVAKRLLPSKGEWGKVKKTCKIVDQIYEITKGLFKAKMPTANLFLPHLHDIRTFLTQEANDSDSDAFTKTLAEEMLQTLNKYWNDMYLTLAIAAFFDPRHKLKLIEISNDGDEGKAVYVLQTIRQLYDAYVVQNDQPQNLDLDLYLEEPVLPMTENFSVLSFWKENWLKYPHLSRMARDFLAIPISVATSHKAYYTEPREADKTVLFLEPQLMNALMCVRSWKRSNKRAQEGMP